MDGTVAYSIMLRNTSSTAVTNIFVAGSIPSGATFSGTASTPVGTVFSGSDQGGASWIVSSVPGSGSVGPFVYTVSKGTATDLSASAFAHWLNPAEGSMTSPMVMPINNDERLAIDQAINNKLNKVDTSLSLWNIQPGLGTVMIEYSTRFANLWFAAQAKNWDMVHYQIDEMLEIQETGETTRPARAPALINFEHTYLDALDSAAGTMDMATFVAAYDKAIGGCNSCHASQSGGTERPNFKFVKIMRPTAPVLTGVDWAGQ